MGGSMQGRLWPRNEKERSEALRLGYDLDRILHTEDLCKVMSSPAGRFCAYCYRILVVLVGCNGFTEGPPLLSLSLTSLPSMHTGRRHLLCSHWRVGRGPAAWRALYIRGRHHQLDCDEVQVRHGQVH